MKKILIILGIVLVLAAIVVKTNPTTEQKCCVDSLGIKDSCAMPCSTYIAPIDTVHDTTVVLDTVEIPREY